MAQQTIHTGKALKSAVIKVMGRDDLKAVVDALAIDTVDRRNRSSMARSLGRREDVTSQYLVDFLNEQQVKEVCDILDIPSTGRRKELIDRLISPTETPIETPTEAVEPEHPEHSAPKLRPKAPTPIGAPTPLGNHSPPTPLRPQAPPSRPPVKGRRITDYKTLAPGARILVRDAEWLVRRVDQTLTGGKAVRCVGISELVRDKEAIFLTEIEGGSIEVLDPADTRIVTDPSPSYRASLLYMESLLRQTPPTDDNLYIGHKAAMDLVPFQLEPAKQALMQPRQRILIADAVGLGKTLECGILLCELIRRGRGKRILVLAIKSMLTQFQKEMWSRFSIPLTRLDSLGIQRIRHRIPTNHNPFYYYDKAIISIDTLKQDAEYRTYLENAYWDIIVIDEAQNVAERGKARSLRSRLADLLASRSDTLIMLSATPHDGRARSFASLMNMLDPTAIADPDDYGPEDIKGLFIRRFKKDIQDQVKDSFQKRSIAVARCKATEAEENAFDIFASLRFVGIDRRRSSTSATTGIPGAGVTSSGSALFKTTLEKALFSSPAACLETISNRIATIEKKNIQNSSDQSLNSDRPLDPSRPLDPAFQADIGALERLAQALEPITPACYAKYQKLLEVIRDPQKGLGWTGKDPTDRLVIFTERIKTMRFLEENLLRDLHLDPSRVATMEGSMSDMDQQHIVEAFQKDESPVRLLIASDVASEGINLHFLCHKMIHFDIPWSLMVFTQRNGRIDRYGQDHPPRIVYLVTDSENPKIRGDTRILELLIQKDEQAVNNIGDPSTWMGVFDIDTEELITAQAIEDGQTAEQFNQDLEQRRFDPLAALMEGPPQPTGLDAQQKLKPVFSLFDDDYSFLEAAIKQIQYDEHLQVELYPDQQRIELTAPDDLMHRFRFLPPETWPQDSVFNLSADVRAIQEEIRRSRKDETAWPNLHFLWPLNPVLEWANDKVLAAFGRHEAPLITVPNGTSPSSPTAITPSNTTPGETIFIISGLVPNLKSHPLVNVWFGVVLKNGVFSHIEPFPDLRNRLGLGRTPWPNRGDSESDASALQPLLPTVVDHARKYMSRRRREFEDHINPKLNEHYNALDTLKKKQYEHLDRRYEETNLPAATLKERKDRERRSIDTVFDNYLDWVQETMTTEDNPYIQVVAVINKL